MATLYAVRREDGTWSGDSLSHALGRCKPGSYQISLTLIRDRTSDQQRKYYRGVVLQMIAQEAGYTDEEMHEYLLQEFAPKTEVSKGKRPRVNRWMSSLEKVKARRDRMIWDAVSETRRKRTNDMDTAEFTAYVESVRRFASSFYGLNIPDPVS